MTVYKVFDGHYIVYPVRNPNTTLIRVDVPGRVRIMILPTYSQAFQLDLNGNVGYLNQGNVLTAGNWYEFEYVSSGKDVVSINGPTQGVYLRVIVYD